MVSGDVQLYKSILPAWLHKVVQSFNQTVLILFIAKMPFAA